MSWRIFEEKASEYDAWFEREFGSRAFNAELRCIEEILRREKPGRPWLEIGVGTGRFARALGIEFGLDPSPRALEIARRRGIRVVRAIGESLPFRDNAFGCVFLVVTICFLDDPLKSLLETRRILSSDGCLIVGFIPKDSPLGIIYAEEGRRGHPFYSIARFYTLEEISEMLEESGFGISEILSTLAGERKENLSPDIMEGVGELSNFVCLSARPEQS